MKNTRGVSWRSLGLSVAIALIGFAAVACNNGTTAHEIRHTVTFNTNQGSAIAPVQVPHGQPVARPTDPTRAGHTFGGWFTTAALTVEYNFNTLVTGALTLHARWVVQTPDTHTVTFNTNQGSAIAPVQVPHGQTLARPADPTRAGYTFGNWFTNAGLTATFDFGTPITESITLHASWVPTIHTVTFNTNQGSAIAPVQVQHGQTVARPTDPTRMGHTFAGWYTTAALVTPFDFDTPIITDTTLFADWNERNDLTIDFGVEIDAEIQGPIVRLGDTGAAASTITVLNPGQFDPGSIRWLVDGVEVAAGQTVTLDARVHGNMTGIHRVTVEATRGGVLHSRVVVFTVTL